MSIDATNWAWGLQGLSPSEKLVLLSFADRAGETHEAWPSWSRLLLDTGITRKTLNKVLCSLQEKGHILKTGEKRRQVYVYRLMGITDRHNNLSTTSGQFNTSGKYSTSGKITTGTSGKMTTSTSGKMTTQNHQLNPKRNPKAEQAPDSIFFLIQNLSIQDPLTQDLCEQVAFYAERSIDKQSMEQSVKVALSLIRINKWKIPSGYKGITSKSIAEKEEQHKTERQAQYTQDAKVMRDIKTKVMGDSISQMKSMLN